MNDVLSSANVSFTRGDLFVLPANFSPTKSFAMLRSVTEEDDGGVSFDCVEWDGHFFFSTSSAEKAFAEVIDEREHLLTLMFQQNKMVYPTKINDRQFHVMNLLIQQNTHPIPYAPRPFFLSTNENPEFDFHSDMSHSLRAFCGLLNRKRNRLNPLDDDYINLARSEMGWFSYRFENIASLFNNALNTSPYSVSEVITSSLKKRLLTLNMNNENSRSMRQIIDCETKLLNIPVNDENFPEKYGRLTTRLFEATVEFNKEILVTKKNCLERLCELSILIEQESDKERYFLLQEEKIKIMQGLKNSSVPDISLDFIALCQNRYQLFKHTGNETTALSILNGLNKRSLFYCNDLFFPASSIAEEQQGGIPPENFISTKAHLDTVNIPPLIRHVHEVEHILPFHDPILLREEIRTCECALIGSLQLKFGVSFGFSEILSRFDFERSISQLQSMISFNDENARSLLVLTSFLETSKIDYDTASYLGSRFPFEETRTHFIEHELPFIRRVHAEVREERIPNEEAIPQAFTAIHEQRNSFPPLISRIENNSEMLFEARMRRGIR